VKAIDYCSTRVCSKTNDFIHRRVIKNHLNPNFLKEAIVLSSGNLEITDYVLENNKLKVLESNSKGKIVFETVTYEQTNWEIYQLNGLGQTVKILTKKDFL